MLGAILSRSGGLRPQARLGSTRLTGANHRLGLEHDDLVLLNISRLPSLSARCRAGSCGRGHEHHWRAALSAGVESAIASESCIVSNI